MLMFSLVCAVTLECIIENQYHSYSSMKRMERIFSHVYGFDCVRYGAAQPVQLGSVSNSGAAANGDSGNGRVMLIDGTSVIHRLAYYKLLAKLHHGHLAHADGNGDWVLTIFSALSFPAAMMLSTIWIDNGEKTTFFSLYSSFENKCLAIVKETLVWLVIDSLWIFILLLIEWKTTLNYVNTRK
ncbi:hypothetical protein P8452_28670 [Trifolium repens]|nr:hypothetical protein P8452_28670 [Trifolium repens]